MSKGKMTEKEKGDADLLAAKVRHLRIDHNLTQAEVAKELNVTPGFISNVEKGRTAMSLRLLIYYARLTGTTLDMLVGEMVPEYKEKALDHALLEAVRDLSDSQKRKVLQIIDIIKE